MPVDVSALQEAHPEWNIRSAIEAPEGGIWALGADGGVFTLNADGSPSTTTPFYGSYPGLKEHQREGTRQFIRIEHNEETGGYKLISNRDEEYDFFDPAAQQKQDTERVEPPKSAPAPGTDAFLAGLEGTLKTLGLHDLWTDVSKRYTDLGGGAGAVDTIMLELPETQAYKNRFPGMEYLRGKGRVWTEGQYITFEQDIAELFAGAGIGAGYYDEPHEIASLIQADLSLNEITERVQLAEAAVNTNPEVAQQLEEYYGIGRGDLTAFFLDPVKGEEYVQRKAKYTAAGIGVEGRQFGGISADEAMGLGKQGVTREEARAGFTALTEGEELLAPLPGQTGEGISRDEQMAFVADDPDVQRRLRREARKRTAQFEGGGTPATSSEGVTGLGSATK